MPTTPTSSASPPVSVSRTILVVGAGIAGMSAALEAAEAGYDIVVIEKEPYLGGRVAQLHKYFPKLCPPYCGLEVNFQRLKNNRLIRFYTMAEVESISGKPGDLNVTITQRPRYVNDRCTACNAVTTVFTRSFADSVDPICQRCGSHETARVLSTFAHLGRKASGSLSSLDDYRDPQSIGRHVEERFHQMGVEMPQEARETIDAARGGAMPPALDGDV